MATASDNSGSTSQLGTIPASEMAVMHNRVHVAQFTALYRQARITNLVSPVIAPVVGFVMLNEIGGGRIYPWVAVVILASIVRAIVFHRFKRGIPTRSTISQSTKLAFLGAICFSGVAWGGGMLVIFPEGNFALQAFLIVVVLGMGAGSAASFGPYFPALAAYVIPLSIPIATILLFQNTAMQIALGSFGYIFLVVLLLLGSSAHRIFASSVRLEFENAYLVHGLEHTQRRLDAAVDSMVEAFALFDADDRLVLVNERLRELIPDLGEHSDARQPYADFVLAFAKAGLSGASRERFDSWVEKFMTHHRNPGVPFEVELVDGRWLRVGEQATSDGGVVLTLSDLTQMKIREAALAESEQRFRDFTRAASDWVWELDADLRFTFVSGRHGEVSGFGPDYLIGKKITDHLSIHDDADQRIVAQAFAQCRPYRNRQITRPTASGEPFHFLSSAMPVFSEDGTLQGYRGAGSDITAIVRADVSVFGIPRRRIFCRSAANSFALASSMRS
jgi:PAS domain S-box-containing protein